MSGQINASQKKILPVNQNQKILHLKEIRNFTSSRIGNEVTQKLISLKCTMTFEVGANGVVDTRILNSKKEDFCTFSDFDRTFGVNALLRDMLEKTGKGGPAEEVVKRISDHAVSKGQADKTILLPGNKAQASILANHVKNLEKIEEAFKLHLKAFGDHPLVLDFDCLTRTARYILGESHVILGHAKEVSLSKDIYPKLCSDYGVPLWFFDQIKAPKDLINHIQSNKPYRLFFHSKGKGSIQLRTEEWSNDEIFDTIPNVTANSIFMRMMIKKIKERGTDAIRVILPYTPNAADEAALEATNWPVAPAFIDAKDFLEQKIKKKVCDLVPWGANTYKSSLERVRESLIRAMFLETNRIEDNSPYWTNVLGVQVDQEIGVPIWETALQKENFEERMIEYFKFTDDRHKTTFRDAFRSGLSTMCGGAIHLAVDGLFNELQFNSDITLDVASGTRLEVLVAQDKDTAKADLTDDEKRELAVLKERLNVTNYVDGDIESFRPTFKEADDYWKTDGAQSLVPNLSDPDKKSAAELFEVLMDVKIIEETVPVLSNFPPSDKVKELMKTSLSKALMTGIDKKARDRFTKLILSFSQAELQMDVAQTVLGTIERFKKGILDDAEDGGEESNEDPFDFDS